MYQYNLTKPTQCSILNTIMSRARDAADIPAELTATTTELNILDGVTATTAELNYLDGVTSNIQTQLSTAGEDTALALAIALG